MLTFKSGQKAYAFRTGNYDLLHALFSEEKKEIPEETKKKILEGLILFLETELDFALEGCPHSESATHLYQLDELVGLARKRGYLSKVYIQKYREKRNEMMDKINQSED